MSNLVNARWTAIEDDPGVSGLADHLRAVEEGYRCARGPLLPVVKQDITAAAAKLKQELDSLDYRAPEVRRAPNPVQRDIELADHLEDVVAAVLDPLEVRAFLRSYVRLPKKPH